jgi:hypothetical protein
MANPITYQEHQISEPLVYRRVSGLAIASVIFAGLFAVVVAIAGIIGIRTHSPLLLPPFALAIPVLGAAFGIAALVAISRNQAVLAGRKLAMCGLWLSVAFGVGYYAFYLATYFAVAAQADRFTLRWIDEVKQNKMGYAFLDTQEPRVRSTINPENTAEIDKQFLIRMRATGGEGPLTMFGRHEMIRVLSQMGEAATVTSLGVQSWEYKSGAYRLIRSYRVTGPEGELDVALAAVGSESPTREYAGRQWYIAIPESRVEKAELTAVGRNFQQAQRESLRFASEWLGLLQKGQLDRAYLETKPATERKQLEDTYARQRLAFYAANAAPLAGAPLAALARGLVSTDQPLLWSLTLPGYEAAFPQQGLLDTKDLKGDEASKKAVLLHLAEAFAGKPKVGRIDRVMTDLIGCKRTWNAQEGRLTFANECKLAINVEMQSAGPPTGFGADTYITVSGDFKPDDPNHKPTWQVTKVELQRAEDAAQAAMRERRGRR